MKFNQKQIKELEENPNVLRVLDDKIFYAPELKTQAGKVRRFDTPKWKCLKRRI